MTRLTRITGASVFAALLALSVVHATAAESKSSSDSEESSEDSEVGIDTSKESISDVLSTPGDDEEDEKEAKASEKDEDEEETGDDEGDDADEEKDTSNDEKRAAEDEGSSTSDATSKESDASKSKAASADDKESGSSSSAPSVDTKVLLRKILDIRQKTDAIAETAERPAPSTVDQAYRDIEGRVDAESIFEWIRANIAFEPYTGAMRGARGALETGSGNSVDQALLASELLEKADIDHRFALGRVPKAEVRKRLASFVGRAKLVSTASVQSDSNLANEEAFGKQRFRNLVGEHVWLQVERREGDDGAGSYRDLDPVLSSTYGSTLGSLQRTSDSLPSEVEARLKISLRGSFTDGQRKKLLTIAGPLSRYSYKTIQFWFTGSEEIENMVVPHVALPDTSRTGGRFLPEKLKRLWIQYDTNVGPLERHFVHTLYRKGAESSSRFFEHDEAVTSLTILPGWTSPTRLAEQTRDAIREATDEMGTSIRRHVSEDELGREGGTKAARSALEAIGAIAPLLYARHLDRLTRQLARTMGVRTVLLQPRILRAAMVRNGDKLSIDLDARGGRLEAIPRKGIPESAATGFLTLFGRIESQLRRAVLRNMTGRDSMSVEKLFQHVQKKGVPVTTLHANNVESLRDFEVSGPIKKRMKKHVVERGWLLLSPKRPVGIEGTKHFGWWSLEPNAGLLRGNLVQSLAELETSGASASPSMIAYSAVDLMRRSFRTARQTLAEKTSYQGMVCESLGDVRLISRSLCATSELLSIPELSACRGGTASSRGSGGGGGGVGFGFSRQSCEKRASKTRCGAAISSAFLEGRLAPMYRGSGSTSEASGDAASSLSCIGQ